MSAELPTVTVYAECFGALSEAVGAANIRIPVHGPATVATLLSTLAQAYPASATLFSRTACARGDTLLSADAAIEDQDNLALIPPVSGGQPPARVVDTPLDLAELMRETDNVQAGALVVFGGTVRIANNDRQVSAIDYSAHGPLAEKTLAEIEAETREKFAAHACRIQHRTGRLGLGDTSVYVVVRAKHRDQAFDAARHAIETLKKRAAIWKNEYYTDGTREYLEGTTLSQGGKPAKDR